MLDGMPKTFTIRVSEELAALVERVADYECRSVNQQVEYWMRRGVEEVLPKLPAQPNAPTERSSTGTSTSRAAKAGRKERQKPEG